MSGTRPTAPAPSGGPGATGQAQTAVGARMGRAGALAQINTEDLARRVYALMMEDLRLELAREGGHSR